MFSRMAVCVPNLCSKNDIERLLNVNTSFIVSSDCQTFEDAPKLDYKAIITIIVFGFFAFLLISSTAYDCYLHYYAIETNRTWLLSYSVLKNGRKIFTVTDSPKNIACVNGIRVFAMTWTVYGHFNLWVVGYPNINSEYVTEILTTVRGSYVMGSSVNVDTFLVLSGVLISYSFMTGTRNKLTTIKKVFRYYFLHYTRLTPSLAAVMLFSVCLLKYFNTGPIWPSLLQGRTMMCKESWWKNLLYIQNYDDLFNLCVPEAWYFAVDMQLFLTTPVLLLGFKKWPKVALSAITALILLSIVSCSITSWIFDIQRSGIHPSPGMALYYTATHARASPWLLGLILGYIMSKYSKEKDRPNIDYKTALITWMLVLLVLGVCVFVGSDQFLGWTDRTSNLFYNTFRRPTWALGMCWVIYSCHFGFGGIINSILSMRIFNIMSKLMFSLYMTHNLTGTIIYGDLRVPLYITSKWMAFFGVYMYSLLAAIILALTIELPLQELSSRLVSKRKKTNPDNERNGRM